MNLASRKCVPCERKGQIMPFSRSQAQAYAAEISGWALDKTARRISKEFTFPDFKTALQFANKVGVIAEEEGHHPDLLVSWGKVRIETHTHALGGLSENDFILAAKIDTIS